MRLKKVITAAALLIVFLIVAVYAFLAFYDLNKFKPMIARAVEDATGRELIIKGAIDIDLGIRPTLIVEDVSFQNAAWGSSPSLARVKRMQVQIAVLPLVLGHFDFIRLVLIEPEVIAEFNSSGTSNFAFDTSGSVQEEKIALPVLIFKDVQIENGLFRYKDGQSGLTFTVKIDRLTGVIPGFNKSLKLSFEGAFNDMPFTLEGSAGPIWAWVEPGYSLPADLILGAGGATAKIEGELRDPIHFKNMLFTISAEGASISDVGKLFGVTNIPQLGAFKLTAKVADPEGIPSVEELDCHIGSEELAEISIDGVIKDLLNLQRIHLNFAARGKDTANLTQLGLPPPPEREAFRISAWISDIESKVYAASDLKVVLGDDEINGQVNLNLAAQVPFLTAKLTSEKFELGPFNLNAKLTAQAEKLAIEMLDLKLGTPDLVEIRLKGVVDDLLRLEGVALNFETHCKNLANLKQLTGRPLPLHGAFNASGKVLIPVHKNFRIPDLRVVIGKNNINGSLGLDLRGAKQQLSARLSALKLDLPSVLLPELAKQEWVKSLGSIRPVKLAVTLTGFIQEFAVKQVDLQAGTYDSVEVRLTGSIENLPDIRGIKLNFNLRGKELAKLKQVTGQSFLFAPLPGQGAYAVSGNVSNPTANNLKVSDLKFVLADNELTGRLDLNLADQPPQYEVELSAPKFNLKPFPLPKGALYEKLNQIDDLGPLKIHTQMTVAGGQISLPLLNLELGSAQLAAVAVKGSIQDLTARRGIDLHFEIQGNDLAVIQRLGGPDLPLQGTFSVSGQFSDPSPKIYRIPSLQAGLGDNDASGWVEVNLSKDRPHVSAELSSQKLDLRPFLAGVEEESTTKAQSAASGPKKDKVFSSKPFDLEWLKPVDADIKLRNKQVLLPKLALDDVVAAILLLNGNLQLKPFTFAVGGGTADVQFDLRSQDEPPRLAVAKVIDQLDLGPMLDELGYERNIEGKLNTDINLSTQGGSYAEMMAGLEGNIYIAMSDGRASSAYLNLLQKYLGSNIRQLLNPFQAQAKYEQINCFYNTIDIKDGLANVKLLLDTQQTSIIGAGDVNLKTETLNLGIKPTPKKGYGLSGIGTVGFSLKELSQPFRLRGTLAHPHLSIDPERMVFTLGKFAGAMALGPAGIAAFFADISLGKKDPCLAARQFSEKDGQRPDAEKADAASQQTETIIEEKNKKKPSGFFDRLFGN
jgi:uncharacterized protein involved in outer membrane biogenesis